MNKVYILILLAIVVTLYTLHISYRNNYIKSINKKVDQNRETNHHSFPLIDNDSKYIELQTKEWIKKRNNHQPCYAMLEKDKIVMTKWMEIFDIQKPTIRYYAYHDKFSYQDLVDVIEKYRGKKLMAKVTHLQSSYGIIVIPTNPSEKKIRDIYDQIVDKFSSCFVCNHDRNDPPDQKSIKAGKKESYYKLYETIKPGILIQDFFESVPGGKVPKELKVLVLGDHILGVRYYDMLYMNPTRYEKVFDEARRISKILGSTLVRVDFFVKESDNPYVPYLNEISLSPNGGMSHATGFSREEIRGIKDNLRNSPRGEYPEIDKLIEECPYRDIPIKKYLTDGDYWFFKN
jgi:hypothetical protein